jgi:cAMP-dependent protein kinase regulator
VSDQIESLFSQADKLMRTGDREGARAPLRRILEINPSHAAARRFLHIIEPPEAPDQLAEGTGQHVLLEPRPRRHDHPLRALMADAADRPHRAGDVIVTEGEFGRSIFALVRGTVALEVGGRRTRIVELRPGAFFGELDYLTGARRTATAVALTDVTVVEICVETLQQRLPGDRGLVELLKRYARARLLSLMADAIATAAPFATLSNAQREALVHKMQIVRLGVDEVLVQRGQPVAGLYLVALGRLEVEHGAGFVKLRRGDIIDDMTRGAGIARASVRAAEPSCVFLLPLAALADLGLSGRPERRTQG